MSENKATPVELGTENIGKLLRSYAVPAIIAMTASSLYNMVDSIFIGQGVGPLAISGLAVTFPLMNLSTAFGTLVGVGAATMLSVLLGQKNYAAANKVLGNIVSLNMIIGLLFMIAALVFIEPILYFFGASENTMPYAKEYMTIILYGNVISHLYFGLNNAMRASGSPKKAMGLTLFTVIFNTILDPIMIFWMDMGIAGAAWATVISQTIAMILVMTHFSDRKKLLHFEKGIIRLDVRVAKDSLEIGFGPFLMNSAACLVTLFINQQLRKYSGDLGIGAYGINNRITFMFAMICMGLNQGMQPIAGYNYGARKYSRVKEVYRKTAFLASIVTTACFLISVLLPRYAVGIFTSDAELMDRASAGLTIMNMMFPIVGFQMISTNLFQCLGMVQKSVTLSISRQLAFLIPLLYALPLWLGEKGIWISFPVSDFLASLLTLFMIMRLFGKFGKLNDGDDPAILGSKL
ncbi:MAG: MATE family efflux transporter [Bacteroidales bacterium]|jgi:MATE efflux family protein|nr:MATE family efflux transporter [Bacteroidales bacterium]